MFGAVDAGLLMDILYREGYREQLTFADDLPPCIYISRDKLTDIPMDTIGMVVVGYRRKIIQHSLTYVNDSAKKDT